MIKKDRRTSYKQGGAIKRVTIISRKWLLKWRWFPLLGAMVLEYTNFETKLVLFQCHPTCSQNDSGIKGGNQSGSQLWVTATIGYGSFGPWYSIVIQLQIHLPKECIFNFLLLLVEEYAKYIVPLTSQIA